MTRRLVHEDAYRRLYEVLDDRGTVVGTDEEPVPTDEETNESTLRSRVDVALAELRTLATGTGSLTAAQLSTAVRLLARVVLVLARLTLRRFDSTD